MNVFHIMLNNILPSCVLMAGLVGNTFGYLVLNRKKINKIGPVLIYKLLFVIDSLYLLQIILSALEYSYGIKLATSSNLGCKFYIYFNYSMATISPWLLVYISAERLISIIKPSKRFILREDDNQFNYFVLMFLVVSALYIPIPIFNELIYVNSTQTNITKYVCDFISIKSRVVLNYYDMILRIFVPAFLMIISSVILFSNFFKMRTRIRLIFLSVQITRFRRDILFAITTIFLNIFFILLNLPFSLSLFLPKSFNFDLFVLTFYIYYMSYAINFYVILATNSLFRSEFYGWTREKLPK